MDALRTHVAGVDVHKDILAITIMVGASEEEPRIEHFECSTMTDDLKAMGLVLVEKGVRDVAMESTGIYWSRHEAERRSCSHVQTAGTTYAIR